MARMPGTEWVGEHGSLGMLRYEIVCLHTIVGNPPAHAAHFSTRADGHIYQSRDTRFQSGANYQGNHRVIAIESDDLGPEYGEWGRDPKRVPAYTDPQIEAIAKILAWCHRTHNIPLEQCPDSRPGSRGIAYHRQGIDGNFYAEGYAYGGRLYGGEVWTKSAGKACPGDKRIAQQPRIIKRARQLAGLERGDTMQNLIIAHRTGEAQHWVGNGIARRRINTPEALVGLQHWVRERGGNATVATIDDLDAVLGPEVKDPPASVPVELDYDRFVDDVVARLKDEMRGTLTTSWVPAPE